MITPGYVGIILTPLYRGRNSGLERLSDWPEFSQLVCGSAECQSHSVWLQSRWVSSLCCLSCVRCFSTFPKIVPMKISPCKSSIWWYLAVFFPSCATYLFLFQDLFINQRETELEHHPGTCDAGHQTQDLMLDSLILCPLHHLLSHWLYRDYNDNYFPVMLTVSLVLAVLPYSFRMFVTQPFTRNGWII